MSRKDYRAIAEAIKSRYNQHNPASSEAYEIALVAKAIADVLESDNPRFDRAKFLKACGIQD